MWELDKSQCIGSSNVDPEEIVTPICTKWWHGIAVAWMEWEVPRWFDVFMCRAFKSTWRGMFPNFCLQHFIYTGEWEIFFTMWGHPYGTIYRQRFAKAGAINQKPNGWVAPRCWPPATHIARGLCLLALTAMIAIRAYWSPFVLAALLGLLVALQGVDLKINRWAGTDENGHWTYTSLDWWYLEIIGASVAMASIMFLLFS